VEEAHLSLLDNQVDADGQTNGSGQVPGSFWSATANISTASPPMTSAEAIYKTNANTLEQTVVTKLQSFLDPLVG
jgi:hypothetical protein